MEVVTDIYHLMIWVSFVPFKGCPLMPKWAWSFWFMPSLTDILGHGLSCSVFTHTTWVLRCPVGTFLIAFHRSSSYMFDQLMLTGVMAKCFRWLSLSCLHIVQTQYPFNHMMIHFYPTCNSSNLFSILCSGCLEIFWENFGVCKYDLMKFVKITASVT